MGAQAANEVKPHRRGETMGRYVVLDELGAGGMGVVYAAYDPELGRKVAIKVLRRPANGGSGQEQVRLLREAQAMAKLSHPNVLSVFDVGTVNGQVFIATEYVDGTTLSDWLQETARSWKEVLVRFLAAGRGLAAAHAAGFVHRDFKPSNVLIGRDGTVRVMDFGLVRRDGEADGRAGHGATPVSEVDEASGRSVLTQSLTRADLVIGTPSFMAPEQHLGAAVDAVADQYSFCVALYLGLYHQFPFGGFRGARLLTAKQTLDLAPLTKTVSLPRWLRRVVLRGLDPEPRRRWPSMDALLAALDRDPGRTALRWAMGVTVLAGALVGGWAHGDAQEQRRALCSGGPAKLVGVWDPPTQQRLAQAFSATELSYANETWARVQNSLENYTTRWTEMHRDACQATHVREQQSAAVLDLRMACLDGRLRELEATTTLFARADAEVVQNAVRAVEELPSVQHCARLDQLHTKVPPPPAHQKRNVDEVRDRFATLKALDRSGKYSEALPLAEETMALARKLDHAPTTTEAQFLLASVQERLGQYEVAANTLAKVAWSAESLHLDEIAAEAQVILVGLLGGSLKRLDAGLRWAPHAHAAVHRLGKDHDLAASLSTALGGVYYSHDRPDEARQHFERALQAHYRAERPDDLSLASHYSNLGVVASRQQNIEEAVEYFRRAMNILQPKLGTNHPHVGVVAVNVGMALDTAGRYESARDELQRALKIVEESLGGDHTYVGIANQALGSATAQLGDYDLATSHYQRALAIQRQALGARHPDVVDILLALASVLVDAGDLAAADRTISEAEELIDVAWPGDPTMTARFLATRGVATAARGRHRDAVLSFRTALEQLETSGEVRHRLSPKVELALAKSLRALGHRQEAVTVLRNAQTASDALALPDRAEVQFELARALLEPASDSDDFVLEARALLRRAAAIYGDLGPGYADERQRILNWERSNVP